MSTDNSAGITILILADGDWPNEDRLRVASARATTIFAADGAWAKARRLGITVDRVVGDLDSLSPDEAAQAEAETEVHAYPAEKDWTDLELAIDLALALSPDRILLYGVLGDRLDHSLAAIFLLEKISSRGIAVELLADRETAWIASTTLVLDAVSEGDRLSLLPVSEQAAITTTGLRYALDGETLLRTASRGVSNVVEQPPVRIDVHSGTVLVIHAPAEEPR